METFLIDIVNISLYHIVNNISLQLFTFFLIKKSKLQQFSKLKTVVIHNKMEQNDSPKNYDSFQEH